MGKKDELEGSTSSVDAGVQRLVAQRSLYFRGLHGLHHHRDTPSRFQSRTNTCTPYDNMKRFFPRYYYNVSLLRLMCF